MRVANDYERDVFNGGLGLVTAIDAEEALRHAGAQPALHRRHPRQAPRRPCRTAQGTRNDGQERRRTKAMVQATRVARGKQAGQTNVSLRQRLRW